MKKPYFRKRLPDDSPEARLALAFPALYAALAPALPALSPAFPPALPALPPALPALGASLAPSLPTDGPPEDEEPDEEPPDFRSLPTSPACPLPAFAAALLAVLPAASRPSARPIARLALSPALPALPPTLPAVGAKRAPSLPTDGPPEDEEPDEEPPDFRSLPTSPAWPLPAFAAALLAVLPAASRPSALPIALPVFPAALPVLGSSSASNRSPMVASLRLATRYLHLCCNLCFLIVYPKVWERKPSSEFRGRYDSQLALDTQDTRHFFDRPLDGEPVFRVRQYPVKRHNKTTGTDVYPAQVYVSRLAAQSSPDELDEHRVVCRRRPDAVTPSGEVSGPW